jgi:hypothetical protein
VAAGNTVATFLLFGDQKCGGKMSRPLLLGQFGPSNLKTEAVGKNPSSIVSTTSRNAHSFSWSSISGPDIALGVSHNTGNVCWGRHKLFKQGVRDMKLKMSLLMSSLAAIAVLGSGCGHSKGVVVVGSGGYYSGGYYYSCGTVYNCSSGGVIVSSGGSSGGVIVSSGGSSGGVVTSSGGSYSNGGSNGGSYSGGSSSNGGSNGYSVDGDTKDVDLQRADLQGQNLDNKAQSLSGQFGMTFESARQLAQLADKMSSLSASGAVSEEARDDIARSALAVAGISSDDVNTAMASMIKDGDQKAVQALMDKAAANLGMSSSAGLRDQILPSLGITF